ncbi:hypothetical protein ABEG18_10000 [Alsobacter sp. KACC 23698]|uniref:Uncharacterized protein n=1 Tax=Alsobacter sp. KACC 23698 TaxID=3149229 RepID=A0AAU7JLW7_9HYPH
MGKLLDKDMEWAISETDRTWTEFREHLRARAIANSFGGSDVDKPDADGARLHDLRRAHQTARERLEAMLSNDAK